MSSNVITDTSNLFMDTSNVVVDTSNLFMDTSNVVIDTSNIVADTSNIVIDTSNLFMDTSNIIMDTSNIITDTSNVIMDTSNIIMDTSNLILDTSNLVIDAIEENKICIQCMHSLQSYYNVRILKNDYTIDGSNMELIKYFEISNKDNMQLNMFISRKTIDLNVAEMSNVTDYYIKNKDLLNEECWSNIKDDVYEWANNSLSCNVLKNQTFIPYGSNMEFDANDKGVDLAYFNNNYDIVMRHIELNSPSDPTNWFIYFDVFSKDNTVKIETMSMINIDASRVSVDMDDLIKAGWNSSKKIIMNSVIKNMLK